jgi:hypothetical protein
MAGGGGFGRLRRILLTLVPVAALTSAGCRTSDAQTGCPTLGIYRQGRRRRLRGHSPYVAASSIHSVGTAGFV